MQRAPSSPPAQAQPRLLPGQQSRPPPPLGPTGPAWGSVCTHLNPRSATCLRFCILVINSSSWYQENKRCPQVSAASGMYLT